MKSVRIYTTSYCRFCSRAKELLRQRSILFEEVDVTGDEEARELLVQLSGGRRTVPQIWVGKQHVGGYTALSQMAESGELEALVRGEDLPGFGSLSL